MATKIGQMPGGTTRHGMGNRPFASYSIMKDGNSLGLTHRVDDEGRTKWQAENGSEKSGLFLVHREAVEWLLGSRPSAPEQAPRDLAGQLAEAIAAKDSDPKPEPSPGSEAAPGESAPKAPEVEPEAAPEQPSAPEQPTPSAPKPPPAAAASARRHTTGRSKPKAA